MKTPLLSRWPSCWKTSLATVWKTPFLPCCGLLLLAAGLAGCDRPAPSSSPDAQAQATATPVPAADDTAERMRVKNREAAHATGDYLREKGNQLKASLKQTGEELSKDKVVWQRQLEEKKRQYQPQIDELKRKADTADAQAKVEYEKQIANLEVERKKADVKLDQLKNATGDAWETFKARWKQEQAQAQETPVPASTP